MADRDYKAAITALNSLQSNYEIVQKLNESRGELNLVALPEMLDFAKRIGYEPSDLSKFNPIHVAGTKGKGSTSAFISSVLCQYKSSPDPKAPRKIGLYTSPHLRSVRERIQIDGEPISEELFSKYFFDLWDRFTKSGNGSKPVYFRYLTLMAFHMFVCEGVDSAVIECGIGGEYDSTNILPAPTAAAVTALGIDHVLMLGGTLPEIAWHKAGIFKSGSAMLSVSQPQPALEVLQQRAKDANGELVVVPVRPGIRDGKIKLGLAGEFQKLNASLAVVAAAKHLTKLGVVGIPDPVAHPGLLPKEFHDGLAKAKLAGRCDLRKDGKITWCLDGAHTLESIEVAGQWFASLQNGGRKYKKRIMIFNQQSRDAKALASGLHATLASTLNDKTPFSHCIFTTNVTFKDASYAPDLAIANVDVQSVKALRVQKELAESWKTLDPSAITNIATSIEEAIDLARSDSSSDSDALVLITGSLHLVGGAIEVLETQGVTSNARDEET